MQIDPVPVDGVIHRRWNRVCLVGHGHPHSNGRICICWNGWANNDLPTRHLTWNCWRRCWLRSRRFCHGRRPRSHQWRWFFRIHKHAHYIRSADNLVVVSLHLFGSRWCSGRLLHGHNWTRKDTLIVRNFSSAGCCYFTGIGRSFRALLGRYRRDSFLVQALVAAARGVVLLHQVVDGLHREVLVLHVFLLLLDVVDQRPVLGP